MRYELKAPTVYSDPQFLRTHPEAFYGRIKSISRGDGGIAIEFFHTQNRDECQLWVEAADLESVTSLKRGDVVAFRLLGDEGNSAGDIVLLNRSASFPEGSALPTATGYLQREVDVLLRSQSMQTVLARDRLLYGIRVFMHTHGFCEIDLPILKAWPDISPSPQFELRTAGTSPLYLRTTFPPVERLLVGLERAYTMGPNFRQGDYSFKNLPEFTMFCMAAATKDYQWSARYLQSMFATLAQEVGGSTIVEIRGRTYDLASWHWISFTDAFREILHCDIADLDSDQALRDLCTREAVRLPEITPDLSGHMLRAMLFDAIFEQCIVGHFSQPVYFFECPWYLAGPAEPVTEQPFLKHRGEGYVGGIELMNSKCVLLSAQETDRWHSRVLEGKRVLGLDRAAQRDPNFFYSIDVGMVPGTLASFGVDRLVMLLLGRENIADVIMYPLVDNE